MNPRIQYRKITLRPGESYFSVYCTEGNLENQHDDVIRWVRRLANRLSWVDYQMAVTRATEAQATEHPNSLFDHFFSSL